VADPADQPQLSRTSASSGSRKRALRTPRNQQPLIYGSETPLIFTPPLRRLTRKTSYGWEAIDFIHDVLGVTLLPWQRWWLIHALERRANGPGFRFRTILTLVGRQNGKTLLIQCLTLWMLYMDRARLVLGVAQTLDIAKEVWTSVCDTAKEVPELAEEILKIRETNGECQLKLTSGARYKIAAANRKGGRALAVDLVIMDELREQVNFVAWGAISKTTMARPNSIIVGISNAGDDESVVLNHLRAISLAALATGGTVALFEWSAPVGCALDDPEAIAAANPALGHTISMESVSTARATDPPAVYRTEVLCQRVESIDAAIAKDAWMACVDQSVTMDGLRDRVHTCLDVSPDMRHASFVAAALDADGVVHLEVIRAWEGDVCTKDMVRDLPNLIKQIRPRTVGWFPNGPMAAHRADLEKIQRNEQLLTAIVPAVCQGLAQVVASRRVVHIGDPLLTAHALAAKKLYTGDGWRFGRRGHGHVDAVYAAAGAAHLARVQPAPKKAFVSVAGHRANPAARP